LFIFRSRIFGGITNEVTTMFNKSRILDMFERTGFPGLWRALFIFDNFFIEYGFIPEGGLKPGHKIAVADSAYTRAIEELKRLLFLPTPLPSDGSNPRVISVRFSRWD
jgi:hypothetical protein